MKNLFFLAVLFCSFLIIGCTNNTAPTDSDSQTDETSTNETPADSSNVKVYNVGAPQAGKITSYKVKAKKKSVGGGEGTTTTCTPTLSCYCNEEDSSILPNVVNVNPSPTAFQDIKPESSVTFTFYYYENNAWVQQAETPSAHTIPSNNELSIADIKLNNSGLYPDSLKMEVSLNKEQGTTTIYLGACN